MTQDTIEDLGRVVEDHPSEQQLHEHTIAIVDAVLKVYRAGWIAGKRGDPENEEAFVNDAANVLGKSLLDSGTAPDQEGLKKILGLG